MSTLHEVMEQVLTTREAEKFAAYLRPLVEAGKRHDQTSPGFFAGCEMSSDEKIPASFGKNIPAPRWGIAHDRGGTNGKGKRMTLREQMRADLRTAMKARDTATVTALRTLLAALDNAEAVPLDEAAQPSIGQTNDVPRRTLNEGEMRAVLQREAAERRKTIEQYERLGRSSEADRLRTELDVIAAYG